MIPRFVIRAVERLELQLLKWGGWGGAGLAGKIKSLVSGLLSWRCLSGLQEGEWIHHSETQRWASRGVQGQLGKPSSFRRDSKDWMRLESRGV